MSILCFDVLALLTKKIENKCLTKFRATSKNLWNTFLADFNTINHFGVKNLKNFTYILVSENEKTKNSSESR